CRERTRDQVQIPGSRPAGIFTAGTAQRMVNVEGLLPGRRIVILGSGDVGMIMARRLLLEGAEVLAVVEILPYVGGLIRNEVQCLHDFQVPLFLEHTVTKVHGERRVEAVTIARVDRSTREPIPGTERRIECDTLLLSVGLIPENELSRMAGVVLDPLTGGAVVDESRQSSVPGIFAGGNVLHVHDLVDNVSSEAEIAGEGAARFAQGIEEGEEGIAIRPGEGIRYVVPQRIRGRQPVTLYLRVKDMAEGVRVRVGDIWERKFRVVKPSEMLKVELSTDELSRIEGRELLVELER
ncbi:MAG: pyridine nucleotide-disulfide oxidoreductase, partial [Deltaproteobacteria bacterium]